MTSDTDLASKALNFQRAWDAAKHAHKAHAHIAAKAGDCKHDVFKDPTAIRCFRSGKPESKWCKACRTRQPYWSAAKKARIKATAAMRVLLNASRKVAS